jgi:hypothetical protein
VVAARARAERKHDVRESSSQDLRAPLSHDIAEVAKAPPAPPGPFRRRSGNCPLSEVAALPCVAARLSHSRNLSPDDQSPRHDQVPLPDLRQPPSYRQHHAPYQPPGRAPPRDQQDQRHRPQASARPTRGGLHPARMSPARLPPEPTLPPEALPPVPPLASALSDEQPEANSNAERPIVHTDRRHLPDMSRSSTCD